MREKELTTNESNTEQKETNTEEAVKIPEIYSENISKVAEYLKMRPQDALDSFSSVIISTLHALGVNKHVTIEFNPDAYENPLHTLILVSKPLEEEWGKDKVNEFIKEFHNDVMIEFAHSMNSPGNKVLDSKVEAVHLATINIAGEYGFDAIIELYFDPTTTGTDAYRRVWVLAKK